MCFYNNKLSFNKSNDLCYNSKVIYLKKEKTIFYNNKKYELNDFLNNFPKYEELINDFDKIVIKKGKRIVKFL